MQGVVFYNFRDRPKVARFLSSVRNRGHQKPEIVRKREQNTLSRAPLRTVQAAIDGK
jgi:hypothetical protein